MSAEVEITITARAWVEAQRELMQRRTMCKAAGAEIEKHWAAHCGPDGYGPINLLNRLKGITQPDLYPTYATAEECKWYEETLRP